MAIFKKPTFLSKGEKNREMPEGLWTKCPSCGEMIHNLALTDNLMVCPKCEYHFTLSSAERIASLTDPGTWEELDAGMTSLDPLNFKGPSTYSGRLKDYQEKTGLNEAIITGLANIASHGVGLAVMDFRFLAASMGSVVGEKITRVVEAATKKKWPIVIVSASGGARMHEGILGLMQMAKTSGALARHARVGLPYISVLTNPTTGGVTAGHATLGDVIIAEPGSMIGFAGPRVIKETTHQDLPPGFQTAEFLEKHGLIDLIVHRAKLRQTLGEILDYLSPLR